MYVYIYIYIYIVFLFSFSHSTSKHIACGTVQGLKKRPPFPPPNHLGELEGAIDLDGAEVVLGALPSLEVVLEASVSVAKDGEVGSP